MQQTIDPGSLELMRAQVAQTMLEHEIVVQALRTQAIVSALFILIVGGLAFFLWQRNGCLNAAFHAEISRHSTERIEQVKQHSSERISLVKQHSLELCSIQMQLLHAFEGIISVRRPSSASSRVSSASATPPPMQSVPTPVTSLTPPPPLPSNRRRPTTQ